MSYRSLFLTAQRIAGRELERGKKQMLQLLIDRPSGDPWGHPDFHCMGAIQARGQKFCNRPTRAHFCGLRRKYPLGMPHQLHPVLCANQFWKDRTLSNAWQLTGYAMICRSPVFSASIDGLVEHKLSSEEDARTLVHLARQLAGRKLRGKEDYLILEE
jgi:hypothetical protein